MVFFAGFGLWRFCDFWFMVSSSSRSWRRGAPRRTSSSLPAACSMPYHEDVVDVLPQVVLRTVAGGVYVVADGPSALRSPAKGGVRTGEDGRQVEAPDAVCLLVALRIRHLGDNPRETAGYRFGGPFLETYEHLKLGFAPRRRVGALPVEPPSQIPQRDAWGYLAQEQAENHI